MCNRAGHRGFGMRLWIPSTSTSTSNAFSDSLQLICYMTVWQRNCFLCGLIKFSLSTPIVMVKFVMDILQLIPIPCFKSIPYFSNISVKNHTISIVFGTEYPEETLHLKIIKLPTSTICTTLESVKSDFRQNVCLFFNSIFLFIVWYLFNYCYFMLNKDY